MKMKGVSNMFGKKARMRLLLAKNESDEESLLSLKAGLKTIGVSIVDAEETSIVDASTGEVVLECFVLTLEGKKKILANFIAAELLELVPGQTDMFCKVSK